METDFSLNHQIYIDKNKKLAEEGAFSGMAGNSWHKSAVWHRMVKYYAPTQWLDYGCGPAWLYQPGNPGHQLATETNSKYRLYDPCHEPYTTFPTLPSVPGVMCIDVIEHIPESDTKATLDYLFDVCTEWMFLFISTKRNARGFHEEDGNTHVTLKTRQEWVDIINSYDPKVALVLGTDYENDTFDHNGHNFTYDAWNVPVLLEQEFLDYRQLIEDKSPDMFAKEPWHLTNTTTCNIL